METNQANPSPIGPLALTQRQLNDWRTLLAKLKEGSGPRDQIEYCELQIDRLENQIYELQNPQN